MEVRHLLGVLAASLALLQGCEAEQATPAPSPRATATAPQRLALEDLKNPESCRTCHRLEYEQWASSMHAYASADPVFIAMNQRGQRETGGELGGFCVQCHAPMAFRDGLTADGLNLQEAPAWAKGVTCYFCHNATSVGDSHANADVMLAGDDVMRGSFLGIDPGVHGVAKSELHDPYSFKSSTLCGSCHDVVNGHGVAIERTFREYSSSVSSLENFPSESGGVSCQGCHMRYSGDDYVSRVPYPGLQKRPRYNHRFPAVDVALIDFPSRREQRQETICALSDSAFVRSISRIALGAGSEFRVAIETDAGHAMPSGAAQDRRLWLQVRAFGRDGKVLFESGTIGDGEVEEHPRDERPNRRQLCMFRDHMLGDDGQEVHMFWEATQDSVSNLLPQAVRVQTTHERICTYRIPGTEEIASLEVMLRMRPIGMDVLHSLVESGDLDPAILGEVPTFDIHRTHVQWRAEEGDIVQMPVPLSAPDGCD